MTDLGFGITLALKDLFTKNAGKIEQSYKSLDGTVATASDSISKNMERVQKGAMLMGAGLATLAIPTALAVSTMASQKALGEMRSMGIQDLDALAQAAEEFSNRWSGTTKAEFIAASYDIKSGIASLSDFAVGEYTKLSGSVSGEQANTGSFGIEYTSDKGEITFTITEGSQACKAGDRATFKTSRLVGNINLVGSEFPQKETVNLSFSGGS